MVKLFNKVIEVHDLLRCTNKKNIFTKIINVGTNMLHDGCILQNYT